MKDELHFLIIYPMFTQKMNVFGYHRRVPVGYSITCTWRLLSAVSLVSSRTRCLHAVLLMLRAAESKSEDQSERLSDSSISVSPQRTCSLQRISIQNPPPPPPRPLSRTGRWYRAQRVLHASPRRQ